MRLFALLLTCLLFFAGHSAHAHEVTIDTAAARAVLEALGTANLTQQEALRVASMPANRMIVRKVSSFGTDTSEARFAEELAAAAQGKAIGGKPLFGFERVKQGREAALASLAAIENDKPAFIKWIDERVAAFSPPGKPLSLQGFLIAGGNSTGFAFGGNDFYLNIAHFPGDPDAVKVIAAHELYHAVQGAAVEAAGLKGRLGYDEARITAATSKAEKDRLLVDGFLFNLLEEGTAMMVGDPALLTGEGSYSKRERDALLKQQRRMNQLATQLDLSLIGLTAEPPISYDDAYALGFYGPDQPLYYLGYAMTKAIAEKKGQQRIGQLVLKSGCDFVKEYLEVSSGRADLPKLGTHTRNIVSRHCSG